MGAGGWIEGERVQRDMGKRILRCHSKTTNEAVLGELGWWRLATRRRFCTLKYWIKLSLMEDDRLPRRTYLLSKELYYKHGTQNWCADIANMVDKYDLTELWMMRRRN